jgi:hypothetical protein
MRFKEFLTELFNTHTNITTKYADQDMTSASFTISSGLTYTVTIGQIHTFDNNVSDNIENILSDEQWDIIWEDGAFVAFDQDGQSDITNTGNAAEVMAGVLQILQDYVKKYNTRMIAYHAKENSRQRLYSAIATRLGFKLVGQDREYFVWDR